MVLIITIVFWFNSSKILLASSHFESLANLKGDNLLSQRISNLPNTKLLSSSSPIEMPKQIDGHMIVSDLFFSQQRPVVLIHLQRQLAIIQLELSRYLNGVCDSSIIISSFHFIVIIQIQIQIDIRLQTADEQNKKKDVKVMKVVHDLKNPVSAIMQTLNDHQQEWDQVKECCNNELEDLTDMLDNLRMEFKSHHLMDVNEVSRELESVDFIKGLKRTHTRLAKNGSNSLRFVSEPGFPVKLWVQRINVKRITNNLISNSLKHTQFGFVQVKFNVEKFDNEILKNNWLIIGSKPVEDQEQVSIEVQDNGNGIPADKLHLIFEEKQTDDTNQNWDGTGLGLPIVKYICLKTSSFIIQTSEFKVNTSFKQYFPYEEIPAIEKMGKHFSITSKYCKFKEQVHECDALQFAEDNPNILKKQEKTCVKNNLSQFTFNNGRFCLDFVKEINCVKCHKILLFTDLNMPQMGGIQLAKELRKLNIQQKFYIVLVTAEEYEDKENIFDYIYYKPLPGSTIKMLFNEIMLGESKF